MSPDFREVGHNGRMQRPDGDELAEAFAHFSFDWL